MFVKHPKLLGEAMLSVTVFLIIAALVLAAIYFLWTLLNFWLIPVVLVSALIIAMTSDIYKDLVREHEKRGR